MGFGKNVSDHCFFNGVAAEPVGQREARIEGVEMEEITVGADGRARSRPPFFIAVVDARGGARGSVLMPSGSPVHSAGRLTTSQCSQTHFGAFGSGASGSSEMRTRDSAFFGTSTKTSAGDRSSASWVFFIGISPPSAKVVLQIRIKASGKKIIRRLRPRRAP